MICCIPTWDGLATPVPEVRDFLKKASYEWRRRLASASRLALRWPLLPPFARRQCPRLTPAQRPEVCHPPRVLTAQVRPTATPAHLSRCLSGMARRSDLCRGPFPYPKQVLSSAKLPHYLTKLVHSRENSVQRSFQPFLSWEEVSPAEPVLPARACLSAPPPPHPSRWMSRTPPGPPR